MQLAENLTSENLHLFVPHRPPMLFIDSVIECSKDKILCNVIVGNGAEPTDAADNIKLTALVEYMAQTCAAYYGIIQSDDPSPPPGVIASIRNLKFHTSYLKKGMKLRSQATTDILTPALSKFHCQIYFAEKLLASGLFSLVVLNKKKEKNSE
jgi:predicted hotdog family 3-hydroxylacyl-ACP dehydratase